LVAGRAIRRRATLRLECLMLEYRPRLPGRRTGSDRAPGQYRRRWRRGRPLDESRGGRGGGRRLWGGGGGAEWRTRRGGGWGRWGVGVWGVGPGQPPRGKGPPGAWAPGHGARSGWGQMWAGGGGGGAGGALGPGAGGGGGAVGAAQRQAPRAQHDARAV